MAASQQERGIEEWKQNSHMRMIFRLEVQQIPFKKSLLKKSRFRPRNFEDLPEELRKKHTHKVDRNSTRDLKHWVGSPSLQLFSLMVPQCLWGKAVCFCNGEWWHATYDSILSL